MICYLKTRHQNFRSVQHYTIFGKFLTKKRDIAGKGVVVLKSRFLPRYYLWMTPKDTNRRF
jgi:hypothetical protein